MKNTLRYFTAACLSFTRLPLPHQHLNANDFAKAIAFLPWVGFLVGAISAGVLTLALWYYSPFIGILLALTAAIVITGATHEDGFADSIDGFLASHKTPKQRIAIMKDPHLGSFASLALVSAFLLKLGFLLDTQAEFQALALILVFATAKLVPLFIMHLLGKFTQPNSKLSQHIVTPPAILFSSLVLLGFHVFYTNIGFSLAVVLFIIASTVFCKILIKHKLGGYNGDCLGFSEQITQCLLFALWAAAY